MHNNKARLAPCGADDPAQCITMTVLGKELQRALLIDRRELSNVSYRDTFLSEFHRADGAL